MTLELVNQDDHRYFDIFRANVIPNAVRNPYGETVAMILGGRECIWRER
jgi:hypothetical protein